jgi:hypothetical protein
MEMNYGEAMVLPNSYVVMDTGRDGRMWREEV